MELPASLEGSYWLACFGQGSRGGGLVTAAYLSVTGRARGVFLLSVSL